MRVLVVMAMHAEAEPVVRELGLAAVPAPPWAEHVPMRLYQGRVGSLELDLVVNGLDAASGLDLIGTQAATASAMLGCEAFKPDLVVSAGTCGGFAKRGGEIGKVYLAVDRVWYHDRRVPIPGFDALALGGYEVADMDSIAAKLNLARGIVTTGDSLHLSDEDSVRIEAVGANAKEMEAAAVAWVAGLFGAKFTALKSVTDIVDGPHPPEEEFFENLKNATERLAAELVRLVHAIADEASLA
jgi:5'-methylthioadenosine nucleosidase